jgi:hypothetical protein
MNKNFSYNKDKAIAATIFVLREIGGIIDLHKRSKILHFADQKHLKARFLFGCKVRKMVIRVR